MSSEFPSPPPTKHDGNGATPERLFIIDDDPRILDRLRERLTARGYTVAVSRSRQGALAQLREIMPNYILLDVMLGDGLGYDVARNVRRDNLLYRVPILFQSIADDELDIAHAFEQGGDDYLSKPYSESELIERLENLRHLRQAIEGRCPVTGFHTLNALRREVDHLLFRREDFAIAYLFMKGLDYLRNARDPNLVKRVGFITGKAIQHTINSNGFYETFSCHLGGGYFMVKLKYDDYRRFRKLVREDFAARGTELEGAGLQRHLVDPAGTSSGPYGLLVGTTHTQRAKFRCAAEMFETLHKVERVGKKKTRKIKQAVQRLGGHNHWVD